ncbi:lipocalin family protein [Muribaculum sp.]|uniref:lipocalin family protein n=1 Tax=Muribaculum sp. TaxID=1918611 RepID=UPI0023C3E9B1|nr:lipocalin family protein [Muribaculum sp.]MDE5705147.1 lipocalin family protein [Muribaculum sp.]
MKLITRAICAAAICAVATATLTLCVGKNTDIEGRWVQPVPGQPDACQGIALEPDGKASSINMATLAYDTWTIEGNRLILGGKSIGNGQTIDFSDTLVIVRLSADTLVLRMDAMALEYTREKCQ